MEAPLSDPRGNGDEKRAPSSRRRKWGLWLVPLGVLVVLGWTSADRVRAWYYERLPLEEAVAGARQRPGDTVLLKSAARRLLRAGRDGEARDLLLPRSERDPQDAELAVLASRAAWQTGDPQDAQRLLRAALARNPGDPEATFRMAEFLNSQGKTAEAREFLLRTVHLDPRRGAAWLRLAMLSQRSGDYNAALEQSDRAEKLLATGRTARTRAEVLRSLGRMEEAEAAARTAVAREPGAEASILLGEILQSSPGEARLREAQTCFRQAADPGGGPESLKLLAVNHRALGEYPEAVKVLRRLIRQAPVTTEAYLLLGQSYEAMGRRDLARPVLRTYRRLQPLEARVVRARYLAEVQPDSLRAQLDYARACIDAGRQDLAREVLARAGAMFPRSPEAEQLAQLGAQPPALRLDPLPPDPEGDAP